VTRARVLVAGLALLAVLAGTSAHARTSQKEPPPTLLPGAGASPWTIGQKRRVDPRLLRTVRYPHNESGGGCTSFIPHASAALVDYYRGFRLAWVGSRRTGYYLNGVAVTKGGARTIDGLVVGRATLAVVKKHYSKFDVFRGDQALRQWGVDRLGSTVLSVYAPTGYESGVHLFFWFGRSNRLVALETAGSGC
jgi:hypothetical protein